MGLLSKGDKNNNKIENSPNAKIVIGDDNSKHYHPKPEKENFLISSKPARVTQNFIGREKIISDIKDRIETENKVALVSGFGGMGKTEVCRKIFDGYLVENSNNIKHIGWVNYRDDFRQSLLRDIKLKGMDNLTVREGKSAEDARFDFVVDFLNEPENQVLLFIDNMNNAQKEDIDMILDLHNKIIITTRRRGVDRIKNPIEVDKLSLDECRELYKSFCEVKDDEIEALDEIIKLADQHTLTVELLAKTQDAARPHIKTRDFLDKLKKSGFDLSGIREVDYNSEEKFLIKHLQKLFDLSKITSEELRVLKIFSVMPYIPMKFEYAETWLKDDNLNITGGLFKKGWVAETENGYLMHPVLAAVIQKENKPSDDEIGYLIPLLADELYLKPKEIFTSKLYFLDFAVQLIKNYEQENGEAGRLCNQIVLRYEDIGNYKSALEYNLKALKMSEEELGESHPYTATAYNNLAGLYELMGDYKRALEYNRKALKINEEELGESHPSTVVAYNNLAGLYYDMGDYENALEYHRKALKISEEELGESHPYTAAAYNNLAWLHKSMCDYESAIEYNRKALKISEEGLGESHPSTATAYNNLAGLYYDMGDCENALKYYFKALKIREAVLGESHPDTALTYNNLALLYDDMENYESALDFYFKALTIFEKVLGTGHPNTITVYENLSGLYEAMGNQEKSLEYLKKSQNK